MKTKKLITMAIFLMLILPVFYLVENGSHGSKYYYNYYSNKNAYNENIDDMTKNLNDDGFKLILKDGLEDYSVMIYKRKFKGMFDNGTVFVKLCSHRGKLIEVKAYDRLYTY